MNYVVDASVALKAVLPGPLRPKALQLLADYQGGVHELLAPDIFIVETANALTKAERQKLIKVGMASTLHARVMRTAPLLYSQFPLVQRALDTSSQTKSAVYDCLYVALAEREGCELVTADDRLFNSLQRHFPFIVPLSSVP